MARQAVAAAKAVSLDPNDPFNRASNAVGLAAMRRFDDATAEAESALVSSPNDADVLGAVAITLARVGRHEQALEVVNRQIRLDPFLAPGQVGNTIGGAMYQLGRYREAAEAATYCTQRAPTNTNCHSNLVAALGQMRSAATAAAVAELLRVSPGFTVSAERSRRVTTYRNEADVDRVADGLRKAGVPE